MDLGAYDIANPYALRASDFGDDMDSYHAALGFLGDVACGEPEEKALQRNGGTPGMLVAWEGVGKFRRVLGKCRQAGQAAREYEARKREQTEDPFRTPARSRLDKLFDPFRRGAPRPDASPGYLRAFTEATRAMTAATDGERAAPGEQRFVSFEDLSPEQAAMAAAQQMPNRERGPAGGRIWDRPINQASFPWPMHSDGTQMPLQRGVTSGVPGLDENDTGGER